jgi:hypothetical protein
MVNDRPGFLIQLSNESRQETPVATISKFRHLSSSPRLDPARSRSAAGATTKLDPGAGLIVSLLLSLGLWVAIWLGVSRLESLWN